MGCNFCNCNCNCSRCCRPCPPPPPAVPRPIPITPVPIQPPRPAIPINTQYGIFNFTAGTITSGGFLPIAQVASGSKDIVGAGNTITLPAGGVYQVNYIANGVTTAATSYQLVPLLNGQEFPIFSAIGTTTDDSLTTAEGNLTATATGNFLIVATTPTTLQFRTNAPTATSITSITGQVSVVRVAQPAETVENLNNNGSSAGANGVALYPVQQYGPGFRPDFGSDFGPGQRRDSDDCWRRCNCCCGRRRCCGRCNRCSWR